MKKEITTRGNFRNRTFTIRTKSAKYRTSKMSQNDFDHCLLNTQNDWKRFLRNDQNYTVIYYYNN
jgi:hypothetical protein